MDGLPIEIERIGDGSLALAYTYASRRLLQPLPEVVHSYRLNDVKSTVVYTRLCFCLSPVSSFTGTSMIVDYSVIECGYLDHEVQRTSDPLSEGSQEQPKPLI
jgi:hypothetical protein